MKKAINFILSRATIVGLSIIAQIVWLSFLLYRFSIEFSFVNWILRLVAVIVVLTVTSNWSNPSYKLAWTFTILLVPIMGLVIYYVFGRSQLTKKNAEKLERINKEVESYVPRNLEISGKLRKIDPVISNQSVYIREYARFPVYQHTQTKYFESGERMFPEMLQDLASAEHFIFIEYFIFSEGHMLDQLIDLLQKKVKQGVEVRIIYDDFGCVSTLPNHYYRQLEAMGIQCGVFNTIKPVLSIFMNNRDHRKNVVIDGKIAYTGGINIADEYINEEKRFGYWKDTGLRIYGDAVWSMTCMFLEMWNYIKSSSEDLERYRPEHYMEASCETDGFVQPYGDSPLNHENIGENVYMNIIGRAKRYVYIFTPYLIIDNEMTVTLCNAAKSGVDVRIVTPGIPDKKLIFLLSQSYYDQLIRNGIKIYQFSPGFIHAKCFVCDDEVATVGSINLDYRSLYLHFENGVWMYQSKAVMQVKEDAEKTFAQCEEITDEFCRNRSIFVRIIQSVFRMFAPLL